MHAADALLDRRVRREAPPARHREGEEHVRKLLAVHGEHHGGRAQGKDRIQRARDRFRVARELHAGRVGEKLALPRDGGLDGVRGQASRKADERHDCAEKRRQDVRAAILARQVLELPGSAVHQLLALLAEPRQSGQDADQPQVERHVSIEDVAELVTHDALQLLARQLLQCPAGDDDHRLVGRVPGDQGIDRGLALQEIHRRHADARSDRHFLDHVEQPALGRAAFPGIDIARAEQPGDRLAAFAQLPDAIGRDGEDAAADEGGNGDVDLHRWPEQRGDSAEARHHRQHGQRIPEHEPARSAARLLLPLEEIQAS